MSARPDLERYDGADFDHPDTVRRQIDRRVDAAEQDLERILDATDYGPAFARTRSLDLDLEPRTRPAWIARWRLRDGGRIRLFSVRSDAHAAAAAGGIAERLFWPVKIEPAWPGLPPCPRCPTGMRAIDGSAGIVETPDGPRDADADLILGCPGCGFVD